MANSVLSPKTVLISTAAAVILKLFAPSISDFIVSDVPSLYSIILSYLRPPYLYLLLNGIIISIFASSKFQHKPEASHVQNPATIPVPSPQVPNRISVNAYNGADEIKISTNNAEESGYSYKVTHKVAAVPLPPARIVLGAGNGVISGEEYSNDVVPGGYGYLAVEKMVVPTADAYNVDSCVSEISRGGVYSNGFASGYGYATVDIDRTGENQKNVVDGGGIEAIRPVKAPLVERTDSVEILNISSEFGKPPVSRRFAQRKTVKSAAAHHSGGRALGVTKPKRHDTLENTWRTITEGHHMPLARHLKKSDTWERVQKEQQLAPPPRLPNKMKKSDTINYAETATAEHKKPPLARSSGSSKLKKEPSLSQDELNRRVEAFIKKFNEEMRLQRQESLNRYQEMLSRGAL